MTPITESAVEQAALEWLEGLGWRIAHAPDLSACDACLRATHRQAQAGLAPDTPNAERDDTNIGLSPFNWTRINLAIRRQHTFQLDEP